MDRILGIDIQLLISMAIQFTNTGIMVAFLSWLLYIPVRQFMKNRSDAIQSTISNAENNFSAAEKLKAQYEEKLKTIEAERSEILEAARARASEREAEILRQAKEEADTIRSRAKLDIERQHDKLKDEVRTQIVEISTLMAQKYVAKVIDKDAQNALLDEAIEDLGAVKWRS